MPDLLPALIRAKAAELGFDLCGFASAEPSSHAAHWRAWIAAGHHGDMAYLADRLEERLDPAAYLPGARSAVCLAINYHVPLPPPAAAAPGEVPGRIARYALADDYHDWIKLKLYDLADFIREAAPESETRCSVDTAPVPERELAARAGLGWIGKNTCLLSPRLGSFLFLATVLTTLDLSAAAEAQEPITGTCGTCTRCLDACPTQALRPDRPYTLDASRCVSYLTIEHKGPVPEELKAGVGDWLYGCDICQDVCPFNRPDRIPEATHPKLRPRHPTGRIDAAAVAGWTDAEWHPFSRRTAIRRLGLPLFKRNAALVVENAAREGDR